MMHTEFGGSTDDYNEVPGEKWTIDKCDHMMNVLEADGIPESVLKMYKPQPEATPESDPETEQMEAEAAGSEFELNGRE